MSPTLPRRPVTSHAPAYPTFERVVRDPTLLATLLATVTLPGLLSAWAVAGDPIPGDTGSGDTGPTDTGPSDTGPTDTGPVDTGPADTGPADTGGTCEVPRSVTADEARAWVIAALEERRCTIHAGDARVSLEGGTAIRALAAHCESREFRVAFTDDDEAMAAFADRTAIWVGRNACPLFEHDGTCVLADCGASRGGLGQPGACGRYVDLPVGSWCGPPGDPARLYDEAMERLLWSWAPGWGRTIGCGCEARPLDLQGVWVLLAAGLAALRRRSPGVPT